MERSTGRWSTRTGSPMTTSKDKNSRLLATDSCAMGHHGSHYPWSLAEQLPVSGTSLCPWVSQNLCIQGNLTFFDLPSETHVYVFCFRLAGHLHWDLQGRSADESPGPGVSFLWSARTIVHSELAWFRKEPHPLTEGLGWWGDPRTQKEVNLKEIGLQNPSW